MQNFRSNMCTDKHFSAQNIIRQGEGGNTHHALMCAQRLGCCVDSVGAARAGSGAGSQFDMAGCRSCPGTAVPGRAARLALGARFGIGGAGTAGAGEMSAV